jgi:hypothetical protein
MKNVDYHIFIDADEVNIKKWKVKSIVDSFNDDRWDALSFNKQPYYDVWALMYQDYKHHCLGFYEDSIEVTNFLRNDIQKKIKELKEDELFECWSAFNGFCIYRTNKFIDIRYDSYYKNLKNLISDEERNITLQKINTSLNKNFRIDNNLSIESCEHLYYHISAIKRNNAKIRISKKILST